MSNSKFLTEFGLLVVGFSPLEGRYYVRVVHVRFFFVDRVLLVNVVLWAFRFPSAS